MKYCSFSFLFFWIDSNTFLLLMWSRMQDDHPVYLITLYKSFYIFYFIFHLDIPTFTGNYKNKLWLTINKLATPPFLNFSTCRTRDTVNTVIKYEIVSVLFYLLRFR